MQKGSSCGVWTTGIGSVLHFLVDGLCICCLYAMVAPFGLVHLTGVFVTYTLMAFATQPLTGMWADAMRWKHWMLLGADVLLALGVLVASLVQVVASASMRELVMFMAASLMGIGNSFFHVWGGKQTALKTGNDIRALGVFVSTGAFGLAVGGLFFSWKLAYVFLLLICLLSVVALKISLSKEGTLEASGEKRRRFSMTFVWAAILALMAFVMFRSSISEVFTSNVKVLGDGIPADAPTRSLWWVLVIGATAMLGKMTGGWISRWLGIVPTLVLLLLGVAACWLLKSPLASSGGEWWLMLTGLFLINCTMPITLYLANEVLKGREGLAFGLLAAALIPGYLLATM
ncbi:MAG: hypothetical protein IKW98_01775 [Prevotella sp.]|nr:hypothetical protein [Prevotella sp.]